MSRISARSILEKLETHARKGAGGPSVPVYRIATEKVTGKIRLALVTDLHGCRYGKGQRCLLEPLSRGRPDAVLLGGDIVDDRLFHKNAYLFLREVGQRYPVFYVSGNHECWSTKPDAPSIKQAVRHYGIQVLEGACHRISIRNETIQICGTDDPDFGEKRFRRQLKAAAEAAVPDLYTVLLSHRPERIGAYLNHGFDLVLTGHAHGGQWRIPGLFNGLYAPGQGIFPPCAGGLYRFGAQRLVVSRGLARESTPFVPRLFNPPELVLIELVPKAANYFGHESKLP